MFEDYLQDSYAFFTEANNQTDERIAKRYYRASVFYAASAMESFINYIAESFKEARNLEQAEIAFLMDKKLVFDSRKFSLQERPEFHSLEAKLKFLFHKFDPEFEFGRNPNWSKFIEFKIY